MRAFNKIITGSAIAAAALAVSACGSKTENTTVENTTITDMNATEGMDTMTDNMTAVDGAMNSGDMGNDMMMSNTDSMSSTTTTNAM